MAKKVKYKITERRWIEIDVETENDELLVIELNRDMNRTSKQEKRQKNRNVSLDVLFDEFEYEIASTDESILDVLLKEEKARIINNAVNSLPNRQRFVIREYFWNNKSLREISRDTGLHLSSVAESFHSAMAKLGILLKDLNE